VKILPNSCIKAYQSNFTFRYFGTNSPVTWSCGS